MWGTADGVKLLDLINPTDYSEMAQNQMEDARIPVWMVNAEKDNIQVIVSQPRENVFAGLNRGTDTSIRMNAQDGSDIVGAGTDTGHSFLMKGPDTITGAKNGFLNIAPDLGSVAAGFGGGFMPLGSPRNQLAGLKGMDASGNDVMSDLLSAFTVDGFTVKRDPATGIAIDANNDGIADSATLTQLSTQFKNMQIGKTMNYWRMFGDDMMPNTGDEPDFTNMTDADNSGTPDVYEAMVAFQAGIQTMGFEHLNFSAAVVGMACKNPEMGNMGGQLNCTAPTEASYLTDVQADYEATLMDSDGNAMGTLGDLFTGADVLNGFGAQYNSNLASFGDGVQDSAFEYMTDTGFRTFDTFVNARSQYNYNMPTDGDLNFAFRTSNSTESGLNYTYNYSYNYDTNPIIDLSWKNDAGETLTQHTVAAPLTMVTGIDPATGAPSTVTIDGSYIELRDSSYDAATGAGVYGGGTGQSAILTFDQSVKRVHNIGGSVDTSIETDALGTIVIRGEALYIKGGYTPVMNKVALAKGDLVGSLQMKPADRLKFVLGADVTMLTNMMVSAQFIQDSNLGFIDNDTEYTTDYATMHLSNGFKKGIKDKNFYSLFFSKPFGASGEHRWNNITMYEEGNGNWNRFDIEYSINDDTQATLEYNKYWGDVDTQFGQLKDASNVQLGIKYSF